MPCIQRAKLPAISIGAFLALFLQMAVASHPSDELFDAAREGTADEAIAAIDAGADVNARDQSGVTPLMHALV